VGVGVGVGEFEWMVVGKLLFKNKQILSSFSALINN
jgi:hypothetical protein